MMLKLLSDPLLMGAILHGVLAVSCALALLMPAAPVLGVHPALKPFKFAVSIGVFLATFAVLMPSVSLSMANRSVLSWALTGTLAVEMAAILLQAFRGVGSHFNVGSSFNRLIWGIMVAAIIIATVVVARMAWAASVNPLVRGDGNALEPLLALAWRSGLWVFLLSAVSGFLMGGRLTHSVGGSDGGPGLPLVNWSRTHGDLRVSHFLAQHGLQLFPLSAWALVRAQVTWGLPVLIALIGATTLVCIGALLQALASRPLFPAGLRSTRAR